MFNLEQGITAYDVSDFGKAFDILMPLAKAGNCEAQKIIAGMYLAGDGVERNFAAAIHWYRLSAEQGDPIAQNNLANLLLSDEPEQAVKWLTASANQGFPFAQKVLGDIRSGALSLASDIEQEFRNHSDAVKWYTKAASQGFPDACHQLGEIYDNGQGVQKDNEQAIQWYQKAAEKGYKPSQEALDQAYSKGSNGLTQES
jgi:uncharacterized protein